MGVCRQTLAGLFFAAVGAFAIVQSAAYRLGTVTQMGPGYFPACLGILLVLLGVSGMIQGWISGGASVGPWRLGQPLLVIASIAFFGVAIDRLGLLPAVAGVVVISCLSRLTRRPVEVLVIAGGLGVLTAFVFVRFLGLPFKLY